jgi:hypothetical protein
VILGNTHSSIHGSTARTRSKKLKYNFDGVFLRWFGLCPKYAVDAFSLTFNAFTEII